MFYTKYLSLSVLSCLVFNKSTTFAIGHFDFYNFSFDNFRTYFNFGSTCPSTQTINLHELQRDMKENFFGQHIGSKLILSALKGNIIRSADNKKPMVMSFHGWTGSGKNFVTDMIARHMFNSEKILNERYHKINIQCGFISPNKPNYNEKELYNHIKSVIKSCETNLFIFDELHYFPVGFLDILIPILTNRDLFIDSRNSIFIFITNSGADSIIKKYIELWDEGISRENMNLLHFDSILQKSAFNEIGGLKKSRLIDSHVIDYYVPFLPLEKTHVMQCIDAELRNLNTTMDSETINEILQFMTFGPQNYNLFSNSGCSRIKALVTTKLCSDL